MGQKVHPNAFRLGVYKPWQARWYGDKDYTEMLLEDMRMRRLILERLRNASISKVETERAANQATVVIWTAKPGIVIGKGGASVDQLRDDLEKMTGKKVRVTNQETGIFRETLSNTDGAYFIAALAPGSYTLVAEALGFKKYSRKDVRLDLGHTTTVAHRPDADSVFGLCNG